MSSPQALPLCPRWGTWALCHCKGWVKKQVTVACTEEGLILQREGCIDLCQLLPPHLMGPGAICATVQVEAVQLTKPSPSSLLSCSRFDSCQMFSARWLLLLLDSCWWELCLKCVPAFSCYLDRPTKHSHGNPSLGRSLTMSGAFYFPKSQVDFRKIMQRYLYHSVAFHMLNSKDTEKVCRSLR